MSTFFLYLNLESEVKRLAKASGLERRHINNLIAFSFSQFLMNEFKFGCLEPQIAVLFSRHLVRERVIATIHDVNHIQ